MRNEWKGRFGWTLILMAMALSVSCPLAPLAQDQPAKKPQEQSVRKVKTRVQPAYPELARNLNMSGVVKVLVTVAPDGKVTEAKIMGGHPLFAQAAVNAVKQWRYEPARETTTDLIEIRFSRPNQ